MTCRQDWIILHSVCSTTRSIELWGVDVERAIRRSWRLQATIKHAGGLVKCYPLCMYTTAAAKFSTDINAVARISRLGKG